MVVSVVVDDREPREVIAAFETHPDVATVEVRRLATGDIVAGNVGFERKTSADYLQSALGRYGSDLREQVRKLSESYEHAYLLVEGDLADVEEHRPGVAAASVRGSMASITARLGVPVFLCGNRERLVDVAVRLVRKHDEEPSARPLSPGAVTGRTEPITKRIYGCIEGVGPGTATSLYETYPTVEAIVDATEEELRSVDGVGPKRAAAIYDAFRTAE